MRITYDAEVDAAFIYIATDIADGEVDHSVEVPELAAGTMTLFHVDSGGTVLGIEIVGASKLLPSETLERAGRE